MISPIEEKQALAKAKRCKHKKPVNVIYAGMPMHFCPKCNTLFGWWTRVLIWLDNTGILPFNGALMAYDGPYLLALWFWITH